MINREVLEVNVHFKDLYKNIKTNDNGNPEIKSQRWYDLGHTVSDHLDYRHHPASEVAWHDNSATERHKGCPLGGGIADGYIRLLAWSSVQKDADGYEEQVPLVLGRYMGIDFLHMSYSPGRTCKTAVAGKDPSLGIVALLVRNDYVRSRYHPSFQRHTRLAPSEKDNTIDVLKSYEGLH